VSSVALTDVESLAGQIRFHSACRALGIKPITGVELRGRSPAGPGLPTNARVVLLARNRHGYETICHIVTRRRASRSARTMEPAAELDDTDGLFVLSDDARAIEDLCAKGIDRRTLGLLLVRPNADGSRERDGLTLARRLE